MEDSDNIQDDISVDGGMTASCLHHSLVIGIRTIANCSVFQRFIISKSHKADLYSCVEGFTSAPVR